VLLNKEFSYSWLSTKNLTRKTDNHGTSGENFNNWCTRIHKKSMKTKKMILMYNYII